VTEGVGVCKVPQILVEVLLAVAELFEIGIQVVASAIRSWRSNRTGSEEETGEDVRLGRRLRGEMGRRKRRERRRKKTCNGEVI